MERTKDIIMSENSLQNAVKFQGSRKSESESEEDEKCENLWFKWRPTSKKLLRECEESILSYIAIPCDRFYVNVGKIISPENGDCKIWTICLNTESQETPLVLIHGMGAGSALWVLNLEELAKNRPVFAIDLLGFGRSSRPNFSTDATIAENEFVGSIEAWREKMRMNNFILLGHSLGAYLSMSYAIKYPQRVKHLILADPWGFKDKPEDLKEVTHIPAHIRLLVKVFEPLNPLWSLRAAGPLGPKLIQTIRADLISRYENLLNEDTEKISSYLYHSNAQNPSGESAFHSMMASFGWAKYPMYKRIPFLDNKIPLTVLYGKNSWVDHYPVEDFKDMRLSVTTHIIEGAGHHIYADKKDVFNEIVQKACAS